MLSIISPFTSTTFHSSIFFCERTVPCANRFLRLINKLQTHLLSVIQNLWQTSSISLSAMFINHFDVVLQMGLVVRRLLCSSFPPSIHSSWKFFHSQYLAQGRTSIISLSAMHPSVHPSPFLSLNINCSSPQ